MRSLFLILAGAAAATAALSARANATPSSTFWTPMTVDIQGYGVLHLGVDNYFTIFHESEDGAGDFPTDLGLTIGVLPFETVRMEVGVDLLEPSDDPLYFNAKIGVPEDVLFENAPTVQLGLFNAGTESGSTDYNIVYAAVGKSIPGVGRVSAGPYAGNGGLLVDGNGKEENAGFMIAFDRGFLPVTDASGATFNRLVLAADYASGNNALGAGGIGLAAYLTPDIGLLAGPVWFNEESVNGEWKWTVQLDVNRTVFGR